MGIPMDFDLDAKKAIGILKDFGRYDEK